MLALSVATFERYGVAVFIGTPFAVGALTAFLFYRRYPASGNPRAARGALEHRSECAARARVAACHRVRYIPEPEELLFRAGVAYPRYAIIEGSGGGAVRHCVFSTGAFVEPITHWEPGARLGFTVAQSPAPLRELSLYAGISPPHLDGYMRARRGEFRLVALPGGRTRLEGSTWYELAMAPEGYWQLFADHLIGRIHGRVLRHIAREAEATSAGKANK
ncbi:MAG TPA: hypothetical protein VFM14_14820 [Gemmatimonadales bacterium]|nr:hypothetical protein [Gemmatimonadales bacterium]